MSRHCNLIPPGKGYTEPGYISAVTGLFDDPLRFKFSPLLPEERADHLDKSDAVRGDVKRTQLNAQLIAERVKEWNLVDGHADPVEIKPVNVLRLKSPLFYRLYGIVLGVDPSDPDPEWSQLEKESQAEAAYESALTERPVTEVLREQAEKNSEAG